MKFALIDNIRTEAITGGKGICPICGSELIAKCGSLKINHWAHKAIRNCDAWWENETEWHRQWKSNFPDTWQEVIMHDEQTKEKHIADVRTDHGLVVEFQHSAIKPQERIARERFYKNIVWIADGTRLERDYPRFLKGKNDLRRTRTQGFFLVDFPDECFPKAWIESVAPVVFDFKGAGLIDDNNDPRNCLYCLYPKRDGRPAILELIDRASFIKLVLNGDWSVRVRNLMNPPMAGPTQQVRVIIRRRESPFVLERGRWKRRRRF
jgi:competence protein CoiA